MGGPGSGRGQFGKHTTNSTRELDVQVLRQHGLISQLDQTVVVSWLVNNVVVAAINLRSTSCGVEFCYRWGRADQDYVRIKQIVKVDATPCNFGGHRFWFRCPVEGCARRVAKLYLGELGWFACRHCCHLVYESQREPKDIRAIRRAERVRERLGWRPGILNGHGAMPTGMHGRTYRRLVGLHDGCVQRALEGHARWLEGFRRRTN
jgi:hypothetical protein